MIVDFALQMLVRDSLLTRDNVGAAQNRLFRSIRMPDTVTVGCPAPRLGLDLSAVRRLRCSNLALICSVQGRSMVLRTSDPTDLLARTFTIRAEPFKYHVL